MNNKEDEVFDDFSEYDEDPNEFFTESIFLISVRSAEIAQIIAERYSDQCGGPASHQYAGVTSENGTPIHFFGESNICMFEIDREGEYYGPTPDKLETLKDIAKYWVKNSLRHDGSHNIKDYELDHYIDTAEYLEMMINLKCKGTYYQGHFKYSDDISDCIDPSHMRGFAFAEDYIDDYFSK